MTDEAPRVAGVMGWPIHQSKSPILFAHWFATMDIAGHYIPLAVDPADFAMVFAALPKSGFRGVNVTVPHKESALAEADLRTETAEVIGAANMIVFDPAQGRIADNTDAYGFFENLRAGAPLWQAKAAPALVLGAGGAARAVVHALAEAGVPEIRIANRSRDRADTLASLRPGVARPVAWDERSDALDGAGLLVNTTSLGMAGKPPLDIVLDAMPAGGVVNDIVYAPLETPLLAAARARGLCAVDGLGMLLHQARPAFRAWFGADPAVDAALRAACLAPRPKR
ncbi:MAG: shikimate dehydrogenase [Pseudomonadota bacterium]